MSERPTLEEQIIVSKMTDEECIKALMPHMLLEQTSFWLHNHCLLAWRVFRWNWFNIYTGERGFIKFAEHRFKEWNNE